MVDFNKINPEDAQKIMGALKDGRIDKNEAKTLGLTPQEAEALNKAFSSGAAEIGDFVLKNEGKSQDGKKQYTKTLTKRNFVMKSGRRVEAYTDKANNTTYKYYAADGTELKEDYFKKKEGWQGKQVSITEDGRLCVEKQASVGETVKKGGIVIGATTLLGGLVGGIVGFFGGGVGAVPGAAGGAKLGALVGATLVGLTSCTPEEPEFYDNSQINISTDTDISVESVVQQIDIDKLIEALHSGNDDLKTFLAGYLNKILDALGEQSDTQSLTLDFIAEILEMLKENDRTNEEIVNYLAQLLEAYNINVENNAEFQQKVLDMMNNFGVDIKTIVNLLGAIDGDMGKLDTILQLLSKIQNQDENFQKQMLNMLISFGKVSEDRFNELMEAMQNDSTKLDAIAQLLAKIQNQDEKFQQKVLEMLAQLGIQVTDSLTAILEVIGNDSEKLDAIAQLLAKMQNQDEQFQQNVLNMLARFGKEFGASLNDILEAIGNDSAKLDAIAQLLAKIQNQDEKFQQKVLKMLAQLGVQASESLTAILEAIGNDSAKLDAIAQLLAKMQDQDEKFQQKVVDMLAQLGIQVTDSLTAILDAIGNDSAKLDAIAQLLAKIDNNIQKYGEDGQELGNKILEAINKLGVDISSKLTQILEVANNSSNDGKAIMELLDKVLAKLDTMDANQQASAKAIIDAIANIKIEGGGSGNVDLSSLEKMLSELLELTSKNNGLLEDIDGKMDVINLTIERAKNEILAQMNKGDATTEAILNALNEFKNISTANDKEILSKMDTIINILNNIKDSTYDNTELMAKLDDILAAIKDHNVTVDITGKVTCECNCGGDHEGILGDLEDILG